MASRFGAGATENKDVLQMTSCWVGIKEQRGGSPDNFYQLEYSLVRVALWEKICLECACFGGVRKNALGGKVPAGGNQESALILVGPNSK